MTTHFVFTKIRVSAWIFLQFFFTGEGKILGTTSLHDFTTIEWLQWE